jgi:hypothetical protein
MTVMFLAADYGSRGDVTLVLQIWQLLQFLQTDLNAVVV